MNRMRAAAALLLVSVTVLAGLPGDAMGDTASGTWRVVAYDGRITEGDREALTGAGAAGIQYLPENSYIAWMDGAAASRVAALPAVDAVEPVASGRKIDPALDLSGPIRALTVTVFAPTRGRIATRLLGFGRLSAGFANAADPALHDLHLLASPSAAPQISKLPEVLYVGPASNDLGTLDELSDQIQAGNYSGTSVSPGYETWLTSKGLDGTGQVVSITDSGIDPTHPDLRGRIKAKVDYAPIGSTDNPVDEPTDSGGHGTHVAGIVAADANGLQPVTRVEDSAGFLYGLGVAPKAQLVDQNVIGTGSTTGLCINQGWPPPYGWARMARDAVVNGATVWNASWWSCEDAAANYIATNREFDALARDADNVAGGNQGFTFVFAAGNNGAPMTVTAPASSKNVISVGASVGRGGSLNSMASFSSRGPARDGRILPTISAPGGSIVSTRSSTGTLACSAPVTDGLTLYSNCSGTSMASPHVAGAVALMRQWWRKTNPTDPSPALTKALLVNTATDMGTANIPNGDEGWGRVNLGTLFDPSAQRIHVDQSVVLDELDQAVSYRVSAADPSKPLKVTLVWTDAPATAGANPTLVNDLDLRVSSEATGATYLGNRFSGGRSVTGGAPNRRDNLENVFLAQPDGTYTVSISAFNLPGDGVPGSGDETDQDFALVLSNAVLAPEAP